MPETKPGLTILGKEYVKPKAPYAYYSKGFSTLGTDLKTQDRYIINQTISTDKAQNEEEIATITCEAIKNNNLISEFLFYFESPEAGTIFNQIKTEICGRNEECAKTLHSLASLAYFPRVVEYLKRGPPFTGDNFDSFDHDKQIMAFALRELVSSHDDIPTLCHQVKLPCASGRTDSLKDHDGQKWKALFDGSFTNEKYPGYSMRTLVGAADLIVEGDDLAHCSGSKVDDCMTSSYQVVSIRGSKSSSRFNRASQGRP